MKILNPSVQLVHGDTVLKHIESVGRTCYKSEDRITDDSASKFINMLLCANHQAMLEHFQFTVQVPIEWKDRLDKINLSNPRGDYVRNKPRITMTTENDRFIISFNARTLNELISDSVGIEDILYKLKTACEVFWDIPRDVLFLPSSISVHDCDVIVLDTFNQKGEIVESFTDNEKLAHFWYTLRFVCDRGVSHEIVRHRVMSFAQESTRYCNYSKSKFGNELTFIKPCFWDERDTNFIEWRIIMHRIEGEYFWLLKNGGANPQQARSILPNSLKTEICVTGNVAQWEHFFELRCDKAAHPQMREVAEMAKKILDIN